jgi:2'-5' RNA ligase
MESRPIRVFFALWPGEAERNVLADWQAPLSERCGGRSMRPETLHVTLVFVGEVAADRLDALKHAAQAVAGSPFQLRFGTVRYWRHNRIVHAVPQAVPPALTGLVAGLSDRLRQQGFAFDARPYQPHVTLLRNACWDDGPPPALPTVAWQAHEFVLVQSLLEERGARYQVLARFPLK